MPIKGFELVRVRLVRQAMRCMYRQIRLISRDRARSISVEGVEDDACGHAMSCVQTVTDRCYLFYLFQTMRSMHE